MEVYCSNSQQWFMTLLADEGEDDEDDEEEEAEPSPPPKKVSSHPKHDQTSLQDFWSCLPVTRSAGVHYSAWLGAGCWLHPDDSGRASSSKAAMPRRDRQLLFDSSA